jgi:RNA polymerase sigma factor (sigma-70 family)
MPSPPHLSDEQVAGMVRAAAAGDASAWDALVERYVALLWAVALRHGLSEADAADVVQNTWVRLLDHIGRLREPARIGSWLATTAQRESLRCLGYRNRMVPGGDGEAFDGHDRLLPDADEGLIRREQARAARHALDALPATWRLLVELLALETTPTYEEIGAELGLPVGSIGPTRRRAADRIRFLMGECA